MGCIKLDILWNKPNVLKVVHRLENVYEKKGLSCTDYGARFYDPSIGRFMQVDPAANEYSNISTYAYVANNPLLFIDPDVKRIKIGKWHQIGFRRKIRRSLRKMSRQSSEAKTLIRDLKRSSNVHRILKGGKNSVVAADSKGRKGPGSGSSDGAFPAGLSIDRTGGSQVGTGEGTGSIMKINTDKSVEGGNLTSTVGHEIYHSSEIDQGKLNPNRMDPIGDDPGRTDGSGIKTSEYRAVQFENHIRAIIGLELRVDYNEQKEGKRTNLINGNHDYEKSSGLK